MQTEVTRSSRDTRSLRDDLERWLRTQLPEGADPTIGDLAGTSANGMSSETLLFDATWREGSTSRNERLAARLAPAAADVPVFPEYDLGKQSRAIQLVGEQTAAPVPKVWWTELDAGAIGTPFFVMGRVDGDVPPDVAPYNFGASWVYDASPADQRRLQDSTIGVIAELHAHPDPEGTFGFLTHDEPGDTHLRRKVAYCRRWYEWVIGDGERSPLVDSAFDWLDEHWPADEGAAVLCWGDSRIGNMMYRDFEPVAVFDWEMACLGPRELDVSWLIYGHRVFEDIGATYGVAGMPGFLHRDDVAATYESLTGHAPRDLDFYTALGAVQYAIVFLRTGARSIHFGEREPVEHIDELIITREPIERMLAGTYWS
jgi:aminoglycoside phosphotransferase (APT) family kinase protein